MVRAAAVVACAAALAACGSPAPPPASPTEPEVEDAPRRERFVIARAEAVSALARDATHLYWADLGGIHRRPLGGDDGAPIEHVLAGDGVTAIVALAARGGRVYFLDGIAVHAVPAGGGAPEQLGGEELEIPSPVGLAAIDDGVIVATVDAIYRVPDRGAPVRLAGGERWITSVAADATHAYWTVYGEDPASAPPPGSHASPADGPNDGAVRRVALAGGRVETVARRLAGAQGVAVGGGRVYWTSDRRDGIRSRAVTGGRIRAEAGGRFDRLVADGAGVVARTLQGGVVERAAGATRVALAPSTHAASSVAPVADDAWIYVAAYHPYDGAGALLALPRQPESVTVAAVSERAITRVRARDGVVYWAEIDRVTQAIAIVRADPRTGRTERIATHDAGYVGELAVGAAGDVYYVLDQEIWRVPRRGAARRFAGAERGTIGALTVHRDHVFWVDGGELVAMRRRGGPRMVLTRATHEYGAEQGTDLVFDDHHAYTTSFGGGNTGVYRITEQGRVSTLYDATASSMYPGRDLVKIGDELFLSLAGSVYRMPLDGAPTPVHQSHGEQVIDLVGAAGFVYALASGETSEVIRIDPVTGDAVVVLRWLGYVNEPGLLAADDTGAYVGLDAFDGVVRITHDAPAAPRTP